MALAQRLQVLQQQGAAAMTNSQEEPSHLRGCGRTALCLGCRISAGLLLSPWWWSVRCGSPGAGSARAKTSSSVGAIGAAPAPAALSSGCVPA